MHARSRSVPAASSDMDHAINVDMNNGAMSRQASEPFIPGRLPSSSIALQQQMAALQHYMRTSPLAMSPCLLRLRSWTRITVRKLIVLYRAERITMCCQFNTGASAGKITARVAAGDSKIVGTVNTTGDVVMDWKWHEVS